MEQGLPDDILLRLATTTCIKRKAVLLQLVQFSVCSSRQNTKSSEQEVVYVISKTGVTIRTRLQKTPMLGTDLKAVEKTEVASLKR